MGKAKRIAIVATSPLQIMLAHNICRLYNVSYIKCFIMTYEGDNRYEKCGKLANDYNYDVQAIQIKDHSSRWDMVKNCLTSIFHNMGFDIVIQGMFSIPFLYAFSTKLLKTGGELIFTDDGLATLQLQDPKIMNPLIESESLRGILSIMSFRNIKHHLYYTIFNNIKSKYYELNKMNLSALIQNKIPQGVYFLGTFQESYVLNYNPHLTNIQFLSLIEQTVNYINEKYPNEKIMYTPHGREYESKTLKICEKYNLSYLPVDVSVEIDYPQYGHYPKVIVGFMSTALFTLKAMYPLAQVFDIRPSNIEFDYPETLVKTNLSEDIQGIDRIYIDV